MTVSAKENNEKRKTLVGNVGMSMSQLHRRTGETDSGGKRQEELIQLPDMSPC